MMGAHMNGASHDTQPVAQQRVTPVVMSQDTPIAYMQPLAITPGLIRWVCVTIIGAIWSLYAAGWLFLPAKQDDVTKLTSIVQVLQTGQNDAKLAVERLTLAVDNLSGLVNELRQNGAKKMRVPMPKVR